MAVLRIPVDLTWNGKGSPGVNVWHLRTTEDSGTPGNELVLSDAIGVLDDFYAAVAPAYFAAGCKARFNGTAVDVQTQETITGPTFEWAGQGSGSTSPHVLQVCVTWRTPLAARRGRGRTFLGPLYSGIGDTDGTIGSTPLNAIRTAAANFVTASQGIAGGAFAVWGRENAHDPLSKVARDITGSTVRDQFAVLRSRRD